MSDRRAYLDYNASAPLLPEARAALVEALATCGNPSSVHAEGRRARAMIEKARIAAGALVGADPQDVVFTSGASEAAATCLTPRWLQGGREIAIARLAVVDTDHPCIRDGGHFAKGDVTRLPVDGSGRLQPDALETWLGVNEAGMLALTFANSETGVLQDAHSLQRAKAAGAVTVVDAVQAAGRLPLDVRHLGCDALLLSGHKLGAMAGVGAIVLANSSLRPRALVTGGGQEKGRRAGTEAVAAIASFGAACEVARRRLADCPGVLLGLRRYLENAVQERQLAEIVGRTAERLPNTVMIAAAGIRAETLQIALDLQGFAVSSGSACSSGKVGPSHVLQAMRTGGSSVDPAAGAIRVSFGYETTVEEIDRFLSAFASIVKSARMRQGAQAA